MLAVATSDTLPESSFSKAPTSSMMSFKPRWTYGLCQRTSFLLIAVTMCLMQSSLLRAADPISSPYPPHPRGARPLYVPDPVLPDVEGNPIGFGCFKACGPSCNCIDRVDSRTTTLFEGKTCEWRLIQCGTHPFCDWHDVCYNSCDFQFPGQVSDRSFGRYKCYRGCDLACIDGESPQPNGGWQPSTIDPGNTPEGPLGLLICTKRFLFDSLVPTGTLTFAELVQCRP